MIEWSNLRPPTLFYFNSSIFVLDLCSSQVFLDGAPPKYQPAGNSSTGWICERVTCTIITWNVFDHVPRRELRNESCDCIDESFKIEFVSTRELKDAGQ